MAKILFHEDLVKRKAPIKIKVLSEVKVVNKQHFIAIDLDGEQRAYRLPDEEIAKALLENKGKPCFVLAELIEGTPKLTVVGTVAEDKPEAKAEAKTEAKDAPLKEPAAPVKHDEPKSKPESVEDRLARLTKLWVLVSEAAAEAKTKAKKNGFAWTPEHTAAVSMNMAIQMEKDGFVPKIEL